ncbi:RagB/SusD family nutrient uptake outer membrane protein [Galbibacter sp. BG1]|uniref:RagB/SusD family nutrient uptake outer membrane protein n=1 Tax=Galbibacter sp. BG1 TaxID=1170699 RepID=UPI0015BDA26F|nr:RagB/SusD family nutrient uptake outer membrane protein [Galbibacter sp. BG1]QLE01907.1 RagB/SusD family nutrient uptake outer membrane protein [Galbibacter sp. BG1]
MKRIFYTALTFIAMASCDVLETEPQTSLESGSVLVDAASANAILLGAYSEMQDINYYGAEFILNNDLIADNSVYQGFYDSQLEIDQKAVPYTNLWVTESWVEIYEVINISNLLITGVDGIDDPQLDRDLVYGEAHAIRALAYFDLLRYFGEHYNLQSVYGLPLLLEPIPDNDFNQIPNLPRSTVQETYNQINNDLAIAIDLLQGTSDSGRMNYWAALSLRARVSLYQKNYSQAFQDADMVIKSSPFALEPVLEDIYNTTEASGESIFEIEYNEQDQSSFNTYTIRRDEYNVDEDLLDFFDENDLRQAFVVEERGRLRTGKYLDPDNSNNAKIFRLTELYLIRSEAAVFSSNDPNAGSADLNEIRDRAGLGSVESFSSVTAYTDALLYERRAELNYEGHRFFDLVRFDRIDQVLGMEDFRKVFPLPRNELQTSDALEQNPGYPSS